MTLDGLQNSSWTETGHQKDQAVIGEVWNFEPHSQSSEEMETECFYDEASIKISGELPGHYMYL